MSGEFSKSDHARKIREELRVRCTHLRTKASFLGMPTSQHEENRFGTAIWWCGKTCEALGPDGATAMPGACDAPGRTCYDAPRRPAP